MTREEIQQRAFEAHKKWHHNAVDFRDAVDVMTDFAMSLITEAEDKAWEAARRTHNLFNCNSYFFDSLEDWRKETQQ